MVKQGYHAKNRNILPYSSDGRCVACSYGGDEIEVQIDRGIFNNQADPLWEVRIRGRGIFTIYGSDRTQGPYFVVDARPDCLINPEQDIIYRAEDISELKIFLRGLREKSRLSFAEKIDDFISRELLMCLGQTNPYREKRIKARKKRIRHHKGPFKSGKVNQVARIVHDRHEGTQLTDRGIIERLFGGAVTRTVLEGRTHGRTRLEIFLDSL